MEIDKSTRASDIRKRLNPWVGIVIHHTGIGERNPDEVEKTMWDKLFLNISNYLSKNDDKYLSAHYHIGRYGEIKELADPIQAITYHAGKSSFWNPVHRKWTEGCNEFFIGIELLGDGNRGQYSEEQYKALGDLVDRLMAQFPSIEPNLIVGHEMVSPGRKTDPGFLFDWRKLYSYIYGQ
jgi:N-acetyl-anhydromuramoyl-L-alanine amidase